MLNGGNDGEGRGLSVKDRGHRPLMRSGRLKEIFYLKFNIRLRF